MKKQFLLFAACGVLCFAACNPGNDNAVSDAQIDSMVNARVEMIRTELMAENEARINEAAKLKADSMIAAMKGGKSVTPKTTTKTIVKTTTAPAPVAEPVKDNDKMRNNQNMSADDQKSRSNQPKSVEEQKKRNNR